MYGEVNMRKYEQMNTQTWLDVSFWRVPSILTFPCSGWLEKLEEMLTLTMYTNNILNAYERHNSIVRHMAWQTSYFYKNCLVFS